MIALSPPGCSESVPKVGQQKQSFKEARSFLKKRTKRLLSFAAIPTFRPWPRPFRRPGEKVFWFFSSEKNALPYQGADFTWFLPGQTLRLSNR
jgi:hypothetical protein